MTYIDELEDAYLTRLLPLSGDGYGYEVDILPDTQEGLEKPASQARITIAYGDSRFGDKTSPGLPEILAMGIPLQQEFISLGITIEADKRRGRRGVYEAYELVRRLLQGWEPLLGLGRTTIMTFKPVGFKDGYFVYEIIVQTTRMAAPAITAEQQMGGLTEADYPPGSAPITQAPTTVNS